MHFVHTSRSVDDTIAAIATPPGDGGIAIIRISGREALKVAAPLFSKKLTMVESHRVYLGMITTKEGIALDKGLLLFFKGPNSFTGEDVIELHCHGGSLVTRKVLQAVMEAGARLAAPGEFSYRAFLNSKIDLAQAEAIQELISAKSEGALKAAQEQLDGKISSEITRLQSALSKNAAILEAWVDFPEEDLEFAPMERLITDVKNIQEAIRNLISTARYGEVVKRGIQVSLVGAPNVGKSSLMNALLGHDRAIVSPIAGTTRDVVHEECMVQGIPIKMVDTAGIRETTNEIEEEGIRRSKKAIEFSDVILFVTDASRPDDEETQQLRRLLPPHKTISIWNKCDLNAVPPLCPYGFFQHVAVSAKEEMGLDQLKQAIVDLVWDKGAPKQEAFIVTSERHLQALKEAHEALERAVSGLENALSAEFVAFDVRLALHALGTILGVDITEEILNQVFSTFCIGK